MSTPPLCRRLAQLCVIARFLIRVSGDTVSHRDICRELLKAYGELEAPSLSTVRKLIVDLNALAGMKVVSPRRLGVSCQLAAEARPELERLACMLSSLVRE